MCKYITNCHLLHEANYMQKCISKGVDNSSSKETGPATAAFILPEVDSDVFRLIILASQSIIPRHFIVP